MRTSYDDVPYPSAVYIQTHPDRSAVHAILAGMTPAPVRRCRVLELGCGDGSNLLSMAYGLPDSEFVGYDLAREPIQRGRETAAALGLDHLTLEALDLLDFPAAGAPFDYIVAHGLYSWVPAEVRDKVLAICGACLAPQGVAYVSYNAYPGNHVRDMVRGMMQYHAGHFQDLGKKVRQSRGLIRFLAESKDEPDVYRMLLGQELDRIARYTDAAFFHDDLSPVNHPVYFHEFAAHAARHGLQYLAEADVLDMRPGSYAPHVSETLRQLESGNTIAREQYADFLRCRAFRQTLLCRQSIDVRASWDADRVRDLHVAGEIRPAAGGTGPAAAQVFHGPNGAEIETARPVVQAAFRRLGDVWPRPLHFQELLDGAGQILARDAGGSSGGGPVSDDDATALADALLQAYAAGFLELHAHRPGFVTTLSDRPVASALARRQLQYGTVVPTLRHNVFKVDGDLGRTLVLLLDGTRDRSALLRELERALAERAGPAPGNLAGDLENNLSALARAAILVA